MNFLRSVRETLTPVRTESAFRDKGVLTPEEFLAAGDLLVSRCPSWTWESGDGKKHWSFLPESKQYLSIRNVLCKQRASASANSADLEVDLSSLSLQDETTPSSSSDGNNNSDSNNIDNDWLATHATVEGLKKEGEAALKKAEESASNGKIDDADDSDDDDDIPDMDLSGFDDAAAMTATEVATASGIDADEASQTRYYDVTITYDKYYQTPRIWLFGYGPERQPLAPEEIYQDVSADHANKTVTIDPHPHTGISCASIHPCKHSSVMKTFIERAEANGKSIRPDQSMFLFLKFISCLIPYIEYDNTTAVDI